VEDAQAAREKLNGLVLDDRAVRVDFSYTKGAHASTPGRYMGDVNPGFGRRMETLHAPNSRRRRYTDQSTIFFLVLIILPPQKALVRARRRAVDARDLDRHHLVAARTRDRVPLPAPAPALARRKKIETQNKNKNKKKTQESTSNRTIFLFLFWLSSPTPFLF